MLPDVIMLGQIPLATIALTGLAGGFLAYWLTGLAARRAGASPVDANAAQEIVPNLAIGAVLGAKLVYVAMDPLSYLRSPGLLILFPYGPLALPAGLAVGVAAVAFGLRRHRQTWPRLLDLAAAPLAIGLAIALLGWNGPGTWAFAPLTALAAATAHWTRQGAAGTAVLVAGALALADQARPTAGTISTLQLAAAIVGTAAWLWQRKKDSSV